MNNLIILGNGFDLAHGMKTSYGDFITYLIEEHLKDPERKKYSNLLNISEFIVDHKNLLDVIKGSYTSSIWENVSYMFDLQNFTPSHFLEKLLREKANKGTWADIETFYFRELNLCEDEEAVKQLNREFEDLKEALQEYLRTEEEKDAEMNETFQYIFGSLCTDTSVVLNFNYTDTVERLYKDEITETDLIHIHGELFAEANPIIFGYAADNGEINSLLDKDENEYLYNIKRHAYLAANNKRRLQYYLDTNENINVFIIGHSCGLSDKLILGEITKHEHVKSIRILYYNTLHNYRNAHINLDRIMRDEACFERIINFVDTCRIPQTDDTDAQRKEIMTCIDRFVQEEEVEIV